MKPDPQRTRLQPQQQSEEIQASIQKQVGQEFESVEEMLRHDAAQTEPPAVIAERLKHSIENERLSAKPWWKRLFS